MSDENIGRKLKALRLYLGLSLTNFGKSIGFSQTHVKRFENGVYQPNAVVIEKICKLYNVVIKAYTLRSRCVLLTCTVNIVIRLFSIIRVNHTGVYQKTHWHIRIKSRLLLVKTHGVINQKGYIIPHFHINGRFDGNEINIIGFLITAAVNGIVQAECPLLFIRITENKLKEPIFVFFVSRTTIVSCLNHLLSLISV